MGSVSKADAGVARWLKKRNMETQEHKRFAVFAYCDYYPSGGIYDIRSSFDTESEAIEFAESLPMDGLYGVDNVYIFDFETRKIVWDSFRQNENESSV